jgi:GTP-binding protein HflX
MGRALVEVWNKIDLLASDEREMLLARAAHPAGSAATPVVAVSAVTGEGCGRLLGFLAELTDQGAPIEALLGAQDGDAMAWLYRHGRVVNRSEEETGEVHLSVRLDAQALGQFERLFPHTVLREAAE